MLEIQYLSTDLKTENGMVHAVRDVSLSADEGEALEVIGGPGSGKNQTMFSVMGLLSDNGIMKDGSITIGDKEISLKALPGRKEYEQIMDHIHGNNLVAIFQDPIALLNLVLCIETQLMEPALGHMDASKEEMKEHATELMRKAGIPPPGARVRQYPYQFFGGMRQRIIIAIAFACDSKTVITDEPTMVPGVTIQTQVLELISHLREETDPSIIMITYDLSAVTSICNRTAIMCGGEIVETGMVFEIFEHPQHLHTIGLLFCTSNPNELEKEELHPIPGSPPDLSSTQENCPFADCRASVMKICKLHMPQETQISTTRRCSCWLQHPKAYKGGEV